jgi:hypothetical protein
VGILTSVNHYWTLLLSIVDGMDLVCNHRLCDEMKDCWDAIKSSGVLDAAKHLADSNSDPIQSFIVEYQKDILTGISYHIIPYHTI